MKICLLESKKAQSETNLPPLGLGYLASFLHSREKNIEVYYAEDPRKILQLNPDLIGISSITRNFTAAAQIAHQIKKAARIPIVVGGVHISALPESLSECFDIGVIGDGEESFSEIARLLLNNRRIAPENLSSISGLVYRENGCLRRTDPGKIDRTLDKYPAPDRDIFINKGFLPYDKNMHMVTSRGCPFRCAFCYNEGMWGKYRYFTAPYVVKELRYVLERYRPLSIGFIDDLFIGHLQRFRDIVRLMRTDGLQRLAWYGCNARANLINAEVVQLLKKINIREVFFGFESASDRILRYLNKTGCTKRINQEALDLCYRNRLIVNASFIIGTPIETKEDIEETLSFINANRHKFANVSFGSLIPLPGTVFWEMAKQMNLLRDDLDIKNAMIEQVDWATFDSYNKKLQAACAEIKKQRRKFLNRLRRISHRIKIKLWRLLRGIRSNRRANKQQVALSADT
ncbi:MAG: radical SAM protein [Candidatus Aureabacteria bacterium]|nr:radical SAM protein [Candidatus Auribacterota bacterium]